MPTYEYRREDGTTFEKRQGINEDPLETCPETGQKVNRIISGGAGVVYKGDGWYVTDYKKNGSRSNTGSAETNTASENNGSETKNESSDS